MRAGPVGEALEQQRSFFEGAARLCVAYSGGLDSTVLLHAISSGFPGRVTALHANHALHGEAARWQSHCERCCAQWNIPLRSRQLQITEAGAGAEAAARDARYAWFESELGSSDLLLLAHHQDDQAETLLLRLLRGAGLQGLAGMPRSRPVGTAVLLRPFLSLPRSALRDYAGDHNLRWVEDPGNDDRRFDRNYLRHEVLPRLEARWPGYRSTLSRASGHVQDALERLPVQPLSLLRSAVGDPGFAVEQLPDERVDAALSLRAWLRAGGLQMPDASLVDEFLRQLASGGGATLETGEWVLERYRARVYCRLKLPAVPAAMAIGRHDERVDQRVEGESFGIVDVRMNDAPGSSVVHGEENTRRSEAGNGEDELSLRFRCGGERLRMENGQHRSLKTAFQSLAIPPWWRDRVPLLFAGEELLLLGHFLRSAHPRCAGVELRWRPPLPEGFSAAATTPSR